MEKDKGLWWLIGWLGLCSITSGKVLDLFSRKLHGPRENVWVSLARALNTTTFCASLATPSTPFLTCLVGVPLTSEAWGNFVDAANISQLALKPTMSKAMEDYDKWDGRLPIGPEPQEIELWDSLNASFCLFINASSPNCQEGSQKGCVDNITVATRVSPRGSDSFWQNAWCSVKSRNSSNPAPGTRYPRQLPSGNRAWSGIPSVPVGGPCTIGKLSLALPHHRLNSSHQIRWKRDVAQTLSNNCNDTVSLWGQFEVWAASFFTPGVAAAKAHSTLARLVCWVIKQANGTSQVLSALTEDLSATQHVVLQNQAAIGFLLLAHGHGCEDFDGLCCITITDHSRSIHKEIQGLIEHTKKIQQDVGFFGLEALTNWLGLSGWFKGLLQSGLIIIFMVLIWLCLVGCVMSCIKQLIFRLTSQAWLVPKQKGGVVESWLIERGHGLPMGTHNTGLEIE